MSEDRAIDPREFLRSGGAEFYEPLTVAELAVLDRIVEAWSAFVALPRCHPTEVAEGVAFVHGLQQLVMFRAAVRAYPDRFTHLEDFT